MSTVGMLIRPQLAQHERFKRIHGANAFGTPDEFERCFLAGTIAKLTPAMARPYSSPR